MLNANQVKVEVDFSLERDVYRIRKVTDSNGSRYVVNPFNILKVEEHENEDDIHKSPEFLEYMKKMGDYSENTEFLVVSYNDEDDGGPCSSHIVKIRTIKDSYNFKILKVFPPSSGSGLRTEIPVDTDRIFCHPNNNRHSIPDELFDYIGELSGSKIETLDILYSYPV